MIEPDWNDDDEAWQKLTTEQFLQGYAASDAIYDKYDPRPGWDEAFGKMAASGDDKLLDVDTLANEFDDQEWRW
jgi:hypothetical protein